MVRKTTVSSYKEMGFSRPDYVGVPYEGMKHGRWSNSNMMRYKQYTKGYGMNMEIISIA